MVNYKQAIALRRDGQNHALGELENKQDLPVCDGGESGSLAWLETPALSSGIQSFPSKNKKHFCRGHICQWTSAYLTVISVLQTPHGKS